jgi:hypothetical protein
MTLRVASFGAISAGALLAGLVLVPLTATGAVGAQSATPAPSAYTPAQPQGLFVGHGVAVVAAIDTNGCAHVLVSRDVVHWRSIAAALPRPTHECGYAWSSASFVSPLDGWLLGRDPAGTTTVLVHTIDGGATWSMQPGSTTGSNGGSEVIGFSSARDGWRQQFALGSNAPFELQHTTTGGATWTTVQPIGRTGCAFVSDVFATTADGFAADTIDDATGSANLFNFPYMWTTTNGGASWRIAPVERPTSVPPSARAFYGQPSFSGSMGRFSVVYVTGSQQVLAIYGSADDGSTWTLEALSTMADAVSMTEGAVTCGTAVEVHGALVSIGSANASTWWTLRTSPPSITTMVFGPSQHLTASVDVPTGLPMLIDASQFPDGAQLHPFDAHRSLPLPESCGATTVVISVRSSTRLARTLQSSGPSSL